MQLFRYNVVLSLLCMPVRVQPSILFCCVQSWNGVATGN